MAQTVTKNFTAAGQVSGPIIVRHEEEFTYLVNGTFSATVVLERTRDSGQTFEVVATISAAMGAAVRVQVNSPGGQKENFRLRCSAYTSGTAVGNLTDKEDEVIESHKDETGREILKIKQEGVEVVGDMSADTINGSAGAGLDWTVDQGATNIHINNFDALQNLAEDTTPQLGGNLDVSGNNIISGPSIGSFLSLNDTTGTVELNEVNNNSYIKLDGSDGSLIIEGGSGAANFNIDASGNIIVNDLSNGHFFKLLATGDAELDVSSAGGLIKFVTDAALLVPVGTTATRPAGPTNGYFRYNTTTAKFEAYENGAWVNLNRADSAIDHDSLLNYDIAQHRVINDGGSGATDLLSASQIDTRIAAQADYAFAYDTSQQDIALANTWEDLLFDTNGQLDGWTHTADTNVFGCTRTGLYLVTITGVARVTTGSPSTFSIRALFNGTEIAGSLGATRLPSNNTPLAVTSNFIVNATTGQNLEVEMRSPNANGQLFQPGGSGGVTDRAASITITRV